jgi:hypothetical protein
MVNREDLVNLYRGGGKPPTEWQTVEQIADALGESVDYIRGAMDGYGIETHSPEENELVFICSVIETSFRMVYEIHFTCQENVGGFFVDFFIIHDLIGIKLEVGARDGEIVTVHSGNNRMVKIGMGCAGDGTPGERTVLENLLRDMGVTTRYIREIDDDDEGW